MLNIIESIRMRLKRRVGCFGLYGYDFMIDEQMKVWLIEINVNPALTTNTNTLVQAIPPVVQESIRMKISFLLHFFFIFVFISVLSVECFEKIRHNQKIFPLKSLKGFKCIYNELERKTSLPSIDQRRATSSTPSTRKFVPSTTNSPPTSTMPPVNARYPNGSTTTTSSPPTSPKNQSKSSLNPSSTSNESLQSNFQRGTISTQNRSNVDRMKFNRSSDCLSSPLTTTTTNSFPQGNLSTNETMVMRYQTIQRYRTNFEILKPATVIAEEWKNLDRTQKDRLAIGGPKALVLVSKSSTPTKHSQTLST